MRTTVRGIFSELRGLLLLVLCCVMLQQSALAGLERWTQTGGPEGGKFSLVMDPITPGTLYAHSYKGGVFKSTNGGSTWRAIYAGLLDLRITALTIDPVTPGSLYAGTDGGVFKSINGGDTWSAINSGLMNNLHVSALIVEPGTGTLYGSMQNVDSTNQRIISGGVFKLTNGGANWSAVNTTLTYFFSLAADRGALYARELSGVLKSTDGGVTWRAANSGLTPTAEYLPVLIMDPVTPGTLYAGTVGGGVFKSTNGAASWIQTFTLADVVTLVVDPITRGSFYAITRNTMTQRGSVLKSTNSGASWSVIYNGFSDMDILSLVVDPVTPGTLYLGADEGVLKSTNGGSTWSARNSGLTALNTATLAYKKTTPGELYAGTRTSFGGRGSLYKSADSGATWSVAITGLTTSGNVSALVVDPTSAGTLYAGTDGDGVFKSTNGGSTWGAINTGLSDFNITVLTFDPTTPGTLYAGTIGGFVFKSIGGSAWIGADIGLTGLVVAGLIVDPVTPNTLYASTYGGGVIFSKGPGGMFKSTNGGIAWNTVNTNLASTGFKLTVDPSTPSTLYASAYSRGVFRSINNGVSWDAVNTGLTDINVVALVVDPIIPRTLYAGTYDSGVFISTNAGDTWSAINTGLSHLGVNALVIDANASARTLYAGTQFGSVYSYTFSTTDTAPDAFTFTDRVGVTLNTVVESNTITVTGINVATTIANVGGAYSINGGAYTSGAGLVRNGDTVTVRLTSAGTYAVSVNAVITIGGVSDTFSVSTLDNTTPNAFTFTDQTGVALSSAISSSPITVAGITIPSAISIVGGTYSINGGIYTSSAGTVSNGNIVTVRVTSSASYSTAVHTTLTIGGVSDTFSVTTLNDPTIPDSTPNAYAFTDQTGVALSTVTTSNTVTVSGINRATAISISGGLYSVNGGSYTAVAGTVNNGDSVSLRVSSSASFSTTVNTILTIGGVNDTFSVTTLVSTVTTPTSTPPSAQTGGAGAGTIDPIFLLLILCAGYTWRRTSTPELFVEFEG